MKTDLVVLIVTVSLLFIPQIWLDVSAVHGFSVTTDSTGTVRTLGNFTMVITNLGQKEQIENSIGSFTIELHPTFANIGITKISPPLSKSWICSVSDSVISCKINRQADKLKGGESLSLTISAVPTSEGIFEWTTKAFHWKSFQNSIVLIGSQPAIVIEADNEPKDRPNIIVITTDEQRWTTVEFMPNVQKLIGVEFTNAFAATDLTNPSRATFLTGQYAHNHGIHQNGGAHGDASKFNDLETLAVWLQQSGYKTAHVGRYLKGYNSIMPYTPPGWNEWYGMERAPNGYYNYNLAENGIVRFYGQAPSDYSTDVLRDRAVSFIERTERPFFLWFTPVAPHPTPPLIITEATTDSLNYDEADSEIESSGHHSPKRLPIPASRHMGTCNEVRGISPNYNEVEIGDKPEWVKKRPPITENQKVYLEKLWNEHICTLKAVDEAVGAIVAAVGEESENTVIIFMGTHGFTLGEHRLVTRENCLYEECVRIPLIISYPKLIKENMSVTRLVQNIDIAPTILHIANVQPQVSMDGLSLLLLLGDTAPDWRNEILLEAFLGKKTDAANYAAIRTMQWKYVEYASGEKELYDLSNDPYELDNLALDERYATLINELKQKLHELLAK
ncbi:MAG: sulfatase family protein [Nitrososphaerales archaeon]